MLLILFLMIAFHYHPKTILNECNSDIFLVGIENVLLHLLVYLSYSEILKQGREDTSLLFLDNIVSAFYQDVPEMSKLQKESLKLKLLPS